MQCSCPRGTGLGLVHCQAFHQQTVFTCPEAQNKRAVILHNFSIRQPYCTQQTGRLQRASPALRKSRTIRSAHPLFPATALLLGLDEPDWTEIELSGGIPTSGLYLQLTVIWTQLMVSSRSTKSELFWVWALSSLDSEGVVLWRLTATAGPVCQILM